jgi:hypothetical protein
MAPHWSRQKWLPAFWTCIALAILWADFVSGPNIAFPYLFMVPVALAARYTGVFWGLVFAVGLPLVRFAFHFVWTDSYTLAESALNAVIRCVVLVGAAILIDRVTRQAREIRILRGLLPICMFYKKIRDPARQWHQIESYIMQHSEAEFTHTSCPECGRKNYGDLVNEPNLLPYPPKTVAQPD